MLSIVPSIRSRPAVPNGGPLLFLAYALQMHNLQGGGLPKTPQMHDNFDGPDCDESSAPKPKYLDVYHYKDCVRHQHIGTWGHPYSHRN